MAVFSSRCRLVLIFAFAFIISSCQSDADNSSSVSEVSSLPGVKLYEQNCVSCHGKKGNLGVSGASDLSISSKSREEKIEFIQKGSANGVMQPYGNAFGGNLSDEEISKIVDHLETFVK